MDALFIAQTEVKPLRPDERQCIQEQVQQALDAGVVEGPAYTITVPITADTLDEKYGCTTTGGHGQ